MRFICLLLLWPIVRSIALPTPQSNIDGSATADAQGTEVEDQAEPSGGGNPLLETIGGLAVTKWAWNRATGFLKKQPPQPPSSAPQKGLWDRFRRTPELQSQANAKAPQPPSGSGSGPFSGWRNRFTRNSQSTAPTPNGEASPSGQSWLRQSVQRIRPKTEVASEQPPREKAPRVLTPSEKGSQIMTPEDLKPFLDDAELNRLKTCMLNHETTQTVLAPLGEILADILVGSNKRREESEALREEEALKLQRNKYLIDEVERDCLNKLLQARKRQALKKPQASQIIEETPPELRANAGARPELGGLVSNLQKFDASRIPEQLQSGLSYAGKAMMENGHAVVPPLVNMGPVNVPAL